MAAATDGWEAEDAKPIAPRVSHGSTGSHAASGPMSLGRSSSRGSHGSAGSHGSIHHGDNSHGTHATKSGSGGWDDEEDDEDAGWDEGDSWQPGPSTPNPPKPARTAMSGPGVAGGRIEGRGSKGSRSGAACLRTSRYLRRGIICGGVLAIVVMGAAAYRYIADGGDGLHSKHLDVEFELDDQAGRSSSFGSSSSPSERLSGGASLSRLAHPNAGASVDGYRSPADREAVVVEEGAGDEGSTPIRAPSPKIAEASSKEETAPVKNTRVAPKAPNLDEETDLDGDLKGLRGSNAPTPVPGGGGNGGDVDARARPSDDEDEEVREEAAGDQTKKVDESKTEDEPRAPSLDDETKVPTSKSSPPQHASGNSASDTNADGDDVFEPEESDDKNKSDEKRPATKTQDEETETPKDSKDGDGPGADSGADSASPTAKTNATKEEKEPLIVAVEDGEDPEDVPPSSSSAKSESKSKSKREDS